MNNTHYIKNMVCVRCKMAVQQVLESLGIPYQRIELGWVEANGELSKELLEEFDKRLRQYELELMHDRIPILVERIKIEIIKILNDPNPPPLKLSAYLSQKLGYNYTYLSNTFSEWEGITLEHYYISQRVERVKELIIYENMSLSKITDTLRYSSVSHLCQQFKKLTEITPAEFKKLFHAGNYVWRPLPIKYQVK